MTAPSTDAFLYEIHKGDAKMLEPSSETWAGKMWDKSGKMKPMQFQTYRAASAYARKYVDGPYQIKKALQ